MPGLVPLDVLLRYPLAPVLIWQGVQSRRRASPLPEAKGARAGEAGNGAPLSVLILGDSSAAGVGVAHQSEALAGQVVERLARHRRVQWHLWAATGATTRNALAWLQAAPPQRFDVAMLALGVNDVTRGVSRRKWLRQQRQLRATLRRKFGVRRIIVTGVPPMQRFPALPALLGWVLGGQSGRFDAALRRALEPEADAVYLTLDLPMRPDLMASDGFHPSAQTYALWAEAAADLIVLPPSAASCESPHPDE